MEGEKLQLLKSIFGKFHHSNDEHLFYCPKCKHHKRKFSINLEKGAFKCWICDYYGRSLRRLIRKCGDFRILQKWDKLNGREDLTKFDDIFSEEIEIIGEKQYAHNAYVMNKSQPLEITGSIFNTNGVYEFRIDIRTMDDPSVWIFDLDKFNIKIDTETYQKIP